MLQDKCSVFLQLQTLQLQAASSGVRGVHSSIVENGNRLWLPTNYKTVCISYIHIRPFKPESGGTLELNINMFCLLNTLTALSRDKLPQCIPRVSSLPENQQYIYIYIHIYIYFTAVYEQQSTGTRLPRRQLLQPWRRQVRCSFYKHLC